VKRVKEKKERKEKEKRVRQKRKLKEKKSNLFQNCIIVYIIAYDIGYYYIFQRT
jgi:hypothetical protein